jgi:hypothetical protein
MYFHLCSPYIKIYFYFYKQFSDFGFIWNTYATGKNFCSDKDVTGIFVAHSL